MNATESKTRLWWVLVGLGVVLYVFFAAHSITKPITTDEIHMYAAGRAIAQTGLPVYYMDDNIREYTPAKDLWQLDEAPAPGYRYALWHPPLFIYWQGFWLWLLGLHEWVARFSVVLCHLLTWGLLWSLARLLYPPEKATGVFGIFALLYAINPLLLQEGMMLDIDCSVLTPILVLLLHEYIRMELRGTAWVRKYGWLSVLVAVSLWAKEFGAVYSAAALIVYVILRRQWRDLTGVVVMLVAGAALFWVTWWLYCRLTGMPLMFFIRFTILDKLMIGEGLLRTIAQQSGWGNAWFMVLFSLLNTIIWTSPFYFVLALLVIGWRLRVFWATKQVGPLDLLLLYVLATVGATQVYRPSGWFLKYEYPLHGVLVLLVAVYLYEKFQGCSWREWAVAGGVAVVAAAAQVGVTGDPVYWFFNMGLSGLRQHHVWVFYAVTAGVLLIALKVARADWRPMSVVAGALLVGTVGANLGLNWKQRAAYVTSITWNNYGEDGFREVVAYLQQVVPPGKMPICRGDFGFNLFKDDQPPRRRWIPWTVFTNARSVEEVVRNITVPEASHIVLDRYCMLRHLLPILLQYYELDQQFGLMKTGGYSFYILRRKNLPG